MTIKDIESKVKDLDKLREQKNFLINVKWTFDKEKRVSGTICHFGSAKELVADDILAVVNKHLTSLDEQISSLENFNGTETVLNILDSADGQKAILNVLSKNRNTLSTIVR